MDELGLVFGVLIQDWVSYSDYIQGILSLFIVLSSFYLLPKPDLIQTKSKINTEPTVLTWSLTRFTLSRVSLNLDNSGDLIWVPKP
jgi:hypothetical protein